MILISAIRLYKMKLSEMYDAYIVYFNDKMDIFMYTVNVK